MGAAIFSGGTPPPKNNAGGSIDESADSVTGKTPEALAIELVKDAEEKKKVDRAEKTAAKKVARVEKLKAMSTHERISDFLDGVLADLTKAKKLALQLRADEASSFLVTKLEASCIDMEAKYLALQEESQKSVLDDVPVKQLMKTLNSALEDAKPVYTRCLTMLSGLKPRVGKRKREDAGQDDA
jgi:hypothetical protein